MREWEILMNRSEDYKLNDEVDKFIWVLDKSIKYTTRSMHRRLSFRGLLIMKLWKSKLPNKIKDGNLE